MEGPPLLLSFLTLFVPGLHINHCALLLIWFLFVCFIYAASCRVNLAVELPKFVLKLLLLIPHQ